jgi:hypothetical protein
MSAAIERLRDRLQSTAGALRALLDGIQDDEGRWKPDPSSWSMLEVVNHLADEEAEDFRTRLEILLHRPEDPFPPIDPKGWVTSRDYQSRNFADSVRRFLAERETSLRWLATLATLETPDLDREKVHTSGLTLSARQMMASWEAHDLLHTRQLTRLRYQYLAHEVAPIPLDYAGNW